MTKQESFKQFVYESLEHTYGRNFWDETDVNDRYGYTK